MIDPFYFDFFRAFFGLILSWDFIEKDQKRDNKVKLKQIIRCLVELICYCSNRSKLTGER